MANRDFSDFRDGINEGGQVFLGEVMPGVQLHAKFADLECGRHVKLEYRLKLRLAESVGECLSVELDAVAIDFTQRLELCVIQFRRIQKQGNAAIPFFELRANTNEKIAVLNEIPSRVRSQGAGCIGHERTLMGAGLLSEKEVFLRRIAFHIELGGGRGGLIPAANQSTQREDVGMPNVTAVGTRVDRQTMASPLEIRSPHHSRFGLFFSRELRMRASFSRSHLGLSRESCIMIGRMMKTLVLIRHAHRDNSVRSRDNGLSEKGREQARWLKKYFFRRFEGHEGVWLASSPKARCIQTLEPISKEGGFEVDLNPDLEEQGASESLTKFEARIHHFLEEWSHAPQPVTLVSSHGDWLPLAAHHLLGAEFDFKKGAWLELEWDGKVVLKSFIPTFKPFFG